MSTASPADTVLPDTIVFLDAPPDAGNPAVATELECQVCGKPLEYSGRGAKPKYCDDHKRGRTSAKEKSEGTRAKRGDAIAARAVEQLDIAYEMLGAGIRFVDPIAGDVIKGSSSDLAESWRGLIATNKRMQEAFAKYEETAGYVTVIAAHAQVAFAIYMMHAAQNQTQASSVPTQTVS